MIMTRRHPWLPLLLMLSALPISAQELGYVIGPRDVLSIAVWEQADLTGKFTVGVDGTFTFPLLGPVTAAGKTLRVLETEIRARLADGFLNDPQVTLAVDQYHSQVVHVVGDVQHAGTYPLSGEMRLIEALARAGSTTERAGGEIVITRGKETIRVSLLGLQTGTAADNIVLCDGDTVFVPRAPMFFVLGEVRQPGAFPIVEPTSVLQAIALAGGLDEGGSDKRVKVVRFVDGQRTERKVKPDEFLQPGDTLLVGQRLF
jgi:polysaccharide biosynthesis/export protein